MGTHKKLKQRLDESMYVCMCMLKRHFWTQDKVLIIRGWTSYQQHEHHLGVW